MGGLIFFGIWVGGIFLALLIAEIVMSFKSGSDPHEMDGWF